MNHSLLAVIMALFYAVTLNAQNREADSLALINLYCSTNGLFWTNTWNLDTLGTSPPIDTWYGVGTSYVNGEVRVTRLDLDGAVNDDDYGADGNNLSGILPDLNLTELKQLYLAYNKLIDEIPDFSNMPKLEKLFLNNNQLSDSIPDFSYFDNLIVLNLNANRLAGGIIDFADLPDLEELYLSHNRLSGAIPDFMNLPKLKVLELGNRTQPESKSNHLTGSIPDFGNLEDLEVLRLGYNGLTGGIPDFAGLPNLRELNLSKNGLSGSIPDFAQLDKLRDLYLSYNGLTGAIPNFSTLNYLVELLLDNNSLTGTIPNFTNNQLTSLDLHGNSLTGQVPGFDNLTALVHLSLNDNSLTGSIPNFATVNLENLNLQNNSFTQDILDLSSLANVQYLNLSNSNLTGVLGDLSGLVNLIDFDVSNNNLTGGIPPFSASIRFINMSSNCLNGEVQNIHDLPALETLDLSNNDLSGGISEATFAGLIQLWHLNISNNNLSGTIPTFELTVPQNNATGNLRELHLEDNEFEGNITHGFEHLALLKELFLDNNNLTGEIPEFELKQLQLLSLPNNNFSGNIPTFERTFSLVVLPDSMGIDSTSRLIRIWLNNNNLTGEIPPKFANLNRLRYLDLYNNLLDGCYDADLDILCTQLNLPSPNGLISNGNNFEAPWESFCGEGTTACSCRSKDSIEVRKIYEYLDVFGTLSINPDGSYLDEWVPGIITLNGNGCVTRINLSGQGLNGLLPPNINLPQLQQLNLSNNPGIDGYIPSWVSDLTTLNLSGCGFGGCYPSHLAGLCGNPSVNIDDFGPYTWTGFCGSMNGECLEPLGCQQLDREALIQLYNATNGPGWNTQWDFDLPMEEWAGVAINGAGCVVALNLLGNGLSGTLPNLNLPHLKNLNLGGNNLTGAIPNFGNMPDLQILYLYDNNFADNIPTFNNLPLLKRLHLSNNNLTGAIPDFDNLTDLRELNLSHNQLKGQIPDFENLPNLRQLYLNNNNLTNAIPDFPNFTNLTDLNLSHNQLSGQIPDFENLLNLRQLYLNNNHLTGTVPNFPTLINLWRLNASYNHLTGNIPNFYNLVKLGDLNLNNNNLTDTIPDFSNCPLIWDLELQNNKLTGSLPDFNHLVNLQRLNASHNNITGNIPDFDLPELQELYLYNNHLLGTIPNFSTLPSLRRLQLNNNILSGEIPDFNQLNALTELLLQRNILRDAIPNFNLPSLTRLELNDNILSEMMPDFNHLEQLSKLELNDNMLTGEIPPAFMDLGNLDILSIQNNQLNGCYNSILNQLCGQFYADNEHISNGNAFTIPWETFCGGTEAVCDTFDLAITLDIINPSSCSTVNGTVALNVLYGSPPYHFEWSDPTLNTSQLDDLPEGKYIVTVTDCKGVEVIDSVELRMPPLPLIDSVDIADAYCEQPIGNLAVYVSEGTPPFEYSLDSINWQSDPVFPGLEGDTIYTIFVSDDNDCTVETTAAIGDTEAPQIDSIDIKNAECELPNARIEVFASSNIPPLMYSIGGAFQSNPVFDSVVGAVNDTIYQVIVESGNGCRDSMQVSVGATPRVDFEIMALDPECGQVNGLITIDVTSGTPPFTYICNADTLMQPLRDSLVGGEYLITVIDDIGCWDSILVTLAPSYPLSFNLEVINEPCPGDNCGEVQVNLSGWNDPYVVGWDPIGDGMYRTCVPLDTTFFVIAAGTNCRRDSFVYFEPYEYEVSIIPESATLEGGEKTTFSITSATRAEWYSEDDTNLDYINILDNGMSAEFEAPSPSVDTDNCERNITYEIITYNEAETCDDTLILPISIRNRIRVPVGITPNGDGFNDLLEIPVLATYDEKFVLTVFNRWGDVVYEFDGTYGEYSGNEWDGTYHANGGSSGKKLPDSDYFYTLKFKEGCPIQRGTIFIR